MLTLVFKTIFKKKSTVSYEVQKMPKSQKKMRHLFTFPLGREKTEARHCLQGMQIDCVKEVMKRASG